MAHSGTKQNHAINILIIPTFWPMKTENNLTQDMKYIYFKEARFVLNKQSHIFFRNLFGKENYNKLST